MSSNPGGTDLRRIADRPDAFEAFYREHLDAIHRFVARRVADPHHASDLVADIFLAAIDGTGSYDPHRGPPVAWLFGIARNVVADDLRQRARERRALGRVGARRPLEDDAIAAAQERIDAAAQARQMYAALGRLPPTSGRSSSSSPSTASASSTPPEPWGCSRSPRGSGFTVPAGPSPRHCPRHETTGPIRRP